MKSKVYIGAHLEKNRRVNGQKRDVLILAAVDHADLSQPMTPRRIPIDRADEGKIQGLVEKELKDYLAALPDPQAVVGIQHKTHSHGTPQREQYKVLGYRRAMVMGPDPSTEEVRFAIEAFAESRGIKCQAIRAAKGRALGAVEDFFGRVGISSLNAQEKRAIMAALQIKSGNFAKKIEQLEKRFEKVAARKARLAKSKLRIAS